MFLYFINSSVLTRIRELRTPITSLIQRKGMNLYSFTRNFVYKNTF
jgi:hypothetical protein